MMGELIKIRPPVSFFQKLVKIAATPVTLTKTLLVTAHGAFS
jgi:hypothetical protein